MIGNDVTSPEVTGTDPKVTTFDRNAAGNGCRRPISPVLGTLDLQGCNSQEVAVTLQEMTGSDLM